MTSFLSHIFPSVASNPVFAGLLGMYGVTVFAFIFRKIPSQIWAILRRKLTVSLDIANSNQSYYTLMALFEELKLVNKLRSIKFSNGKYASSNKIIKGIGLGHHFFWYKKHLIFLSVSNEQSNDIEEKLSVNLWKWGRSHRIFDELKKDLEDRAEYKDPTIVNVSTFNGYDWTSGIDIPIRTFDSILMPQESRDIITKGLDHFLNSESWYTERGIPYHYGIALYGPPGTGKTSLIRAIATRLKMDICYMPVKNVPSIVKAIAEMDDKCILVIEDVDTSITFEKRTGKKKSLPQAIQKIVGGNLAKIDSESSDGQEEGSEENSGEAIKGLFREDLSTLLNSFDGLLSRHGLVIILTTNHIDRLDPAILRPGRIDICLEMGFVTPETFSAFAKKFFSETIDEKSFTMVKECSMAELQKDFLDGKDLDWMIQHYIKTVSTSPNRTKIGVKK